MGQFPQDGNFGQNVSVFKKKKSARVTKSEKLSLIFQLLFSNCVPWILKKLNWTNENKFKRRSAPLFLAL